MQKCLWQICDSSKLKSTQMFFTRLNVETSLMVHPYHCILPTIKKAIYLHMQQFAWNFKKLHWVKKVYPEILYNRTLHLCNILKNDKISGMKDRLVIAKFEGTKGYSYKRITCRVLLWWIYSVSSLVWWIQHANLCQIQLYRIKWTHTNMSINYILNL